MNYYFCGSPHPAASPVSLSSSFTILLVLVLVGLEILRNLQQMEDWFIVSYFKFTEAAEQKQDVQLQQQC